MTVRCGRVANRFVLRMASATGRVCVYGRHRVGLRRLAHGPSVVFPTSLRWHDRGGATIGPPTTARAYGSPRLSPDQTSVLVAITDATTAQPDLWLLAPARGTSSRVTSDPSSDWFPVWSHDGSGMFFGSARIGSTTIFEGWGVTRSRVQTVSWWGVWPPIPTTSRRTDNSCCISPPAVATISA